jgi:glycosyltransferase involved in cell wall biosynthesis
VQTDWNLVIVGIGPSENVLKAYAKELELERISFVGRTNNPQVFYKESSIFMMTSRYEGFGMTLTEAQQFGCIPFAFDNFPVLHDIIDNERNGIIISSNSENEYAEKMLSLMCNHEKLSTLAKQAIKDCRKFSIENIGKQWLMLFDTLIPEKT